MGFWARDLFEFKDIERDSCLVGRRGEGVLIDHFEMGTTKVHHQNDQLIGKKG